MAAEYFDDKQRFIGDAAFGVIETRNLTYDEFVHCKCLGHDDGTVDPRATQYANNTQGLVKLQSENLFTSLKSKVRDS